LYHHQPDPLPLTSFADRAWLINNACCYSVVAVIEAPDAATALHAAQCKAEVRRLPRATVVRAGNLLRKTLPGDVLVTSTRAWMVDASGQVCPIASQKSASWKRIDLHSTVDALAWSPDGRLLAAAENDRRVVLLSLQSENAYPPAYRRGEYAAAERLAWSPDGTRLASTGSQSEVHLWKPAAWRTTGFHTGYTGSILICGIEDVYCPYEHVYALAWSPDGRQIVAGREDGCLLSWDTSTGGDYHCQKRHARAITALAFSPRETHSLFTASADATVRLWDEATGKEQWRAEQSGRVMAAVWSPDGRL